MNDSVRILVDLEVWKEAQSLIKELSEDLRCEISDHYTDPAHLHPGEKRRYLRDMEPVSRAEMFLTSNSSIGDK